MRSAELSLRCQVNNTQMTPPQHWITLCFLKVKPLRSGTGWVFSQPRVRVNLLRGDGSAGPTARSGADLRRAIGTASVGRKGKAEAGAR